MSITLIPTSPDPFYTQVVQLEGETFVFEFRWNQREETYRLSIFDPQQVSLVEGIKIVCNLPLLRRCSNNALPPGELVAVCADPNTMPPRLDDFGEGLRVTLYYVSSDELAPPNGLESL